MNGKHKIVFLLSKFKLAHADPAALSHKAQIDGWSFESMTLEDSQKCICLAVRACSGVNKCR